MAFVIEQAQKQCGIERFSQYFHPGQISLIGAVGLVEPADDIATDRRVLSFVLTPAYPGCLKPVLIVILTACQQLFRQLIIEHILQYDKTCVVELLDYVLHGGRPDDGRTR